MTGGALGIDPGHLEYPHCGYAYQCNGGLGVVRSCELFRRTLGDGLIKVVETAELVGPFKELGGLGVLLQVGVHSHRL